VYRAKQLWECGENIYLAGLNEDGMTSSSLCIISELCVTTNSVQPSSLKRSVFKGETIQ